MVSLKNNKNINQTISAIATAHGTGAISIIRISGNLALDIASKITHKNIDFFAPREAKLVTIYNIENKKIDKCIVIYFKSPYSFTGEDIIEFQTHGGIMIAKMVLQLTLKFGARLSRAGEFSQRAFLNGKIDLSEAEAISELINAKSEQAVFELSKQLHGSLKIEVENIRSELLNILAHSEVVIDYAEDDLPTDIEQEIINKLSIITIKLKELLKSSKMRNRIFEGFKIAIVGRPNVGKSSLLNKLLNYERAIVSDIAGTTRDRVEDYLNIGTHSVKIVDTAGIRESIDEIEKIGIARSLDAINESDIVLAIFDGSQHLTDEDHKIISILNEYKNSKKIFAVLNKNDLGLMIKNIAEFEIINISTKINNIQHLIEQIEKYLTSINNSAESGTILSSTRQIDEVEKTLIAIEEALEPLKNGELEFFSFHINEAIERISNISRPYNYNEMLDKMFGNFCLGK